MNNYYTRLSEALLNKYSEPLNEAWADSMPNWMKSSMNRGHDNVKSSKIYKKAYNDAINNGYGSWRASTAAMKAWEDAKGTAVRDFADYQSPRNEFIPDRQKSLFGAFQKQGIDLNSPNIKFIEGDMPTKNSDPRVQPPNIPIWHIPSRAGAAYDQVYARGINDLEKPYAPLNSDAVGNYHSTPFKHWSIKKLAEASDKFCYIDGSTIEKRDYNQIDNDREQWKRDKIDLINNGLERAPDSLSNYYDLDASGYVKIPPAKKYAKQLELLHLKKWSKDLLKVEETLNDVWSTYQSTISAARITDIRDMEYDMRSFISSFSSAIGNYNDALYEIDRLTARYSKDSEDFLKALQRSDFKHYLHYAETYINRAEDEFKRHALKPLDF